MRSPFDWLRANGLLNSENTVPDQIQPTQPASSTDTPIVDNTARKRYELIADHHIAFVAYERTPGTIRFIHTVVPKALEGRGIGSRLARYVLDKARADGEKVIAECPFIAAYIKKHPEYADLLV